MVETRRGTPARMRARAQSAALGRGGEGQSLRSPSKRSQIIRRGSSSTPATRKVSAPEADDEAGFSSSGGGGGREVPGTDSAASKKKRKGKGKGKKQTDQDQGLTITPNSPSPPPSSVGGAAADEGDEGAAPTSTWYSEAVREGRKIQSFPSSDPHVNLEEDAKRKEESREELEAFLAGCGMEAYLAEFTKNKICEVDMLDEIDPAEFAEMNVPIGDRKELAKAKRAHDMRVYKFPETINIPVVHKLMVKHFIEDDEKIELIGTFIHHQSGTWNETELFDFRFNDISTQNAVPRRTQKIPNFGTRTVFNVVVPMTKEPVFLNFPFQVYKLNALVELSSASFRNDNNGEFQLRPNLMVSNKDERSLVGIRKVKELDVHLRTLSLMCPAPHVSLKYEIDKSYSPKYELSFYVEEPWGAKVIRSVLPIFLVAALSTLNVINKTEDNANLENSIAISLTLVFLLPELKPHTIFTQRKDGGGGGGGGGWFGGVGAITAVTSDDLMIILLFLGLVLASCNWSPDSMAQRVLNKTCSAVGGAASMASDPFFPAGGVDCGYGVVVGFPASVVAFGFSGLALLWHRMIVGCSTKPPWWQSIVWMVVAFLGWWILPAVLFPELWTDVLALFSCDDVTLGYFGNLCIWLSMCIPYYNYRLYKTLADKIQDTSKAKDTNDPDRQAFCESVDGKSKYKWDAYDTKDKDAKLMHKQLETIVECAEEDKDAPIKLNKKKKPVKQWKQHSGLVDVWDATKDGKFLELKLGPSHE